MVCQRKSDLEDEPALEILAGGGMGHWADPWCWGQAPALSQQSSCWRNGNHWELISLQTWLAEQGFRKGNFRSPS